MVKYWDLDLEEESMRGGKCTSNNIQTESTRIGDEHFWFGTSPKWHPNDTTVREIKTEFFWNSESVIPRSHKGTDRLVPSGSSW